MKDARAGVSSVPLAIERRRPLAAFIELTKPRLNLLVVATSAAGYYLGTSDIELGNMAMAVIGTALVAGGAAVLNQVYERDTDALMRRTRERPLPGGRVAPSEARVFGVALAIAGVGLLVATTNLLAAALAIMTIGVYLFVYTPLKRKSQVATLVGAVPGALPPLIGWTAANGGISAGGLTLFTIVFLWQIPHFMAIAWLYRDDYERAGFPMLPVIEPDGRRTGAQALLYTFLLLPVSLAPAFVGVSGQGYFWTALVLGMALLYCSIRFAANRSETTARQLFLGSITYLPLIWAAMMAFH